MSKHTSAAPVVVMAKILLFASLFSCMPKPPLTQMPTHQAADSEFDLARDELLAAFRAGRQAREFGWEPIRIEQLDVTTVNRNQVTGLPSTQEMVALVAWSQTNGECWVAGFRFSRRYAVEANEWESGFNMLVGYSLPPDRIACDAVGH